IRAVKRQQVGFPKPFRASFNPRLAHDRHRLHRLSHLRRASLADRVGNSIKPFVAGLYGKASMHVPAEIVAEASSLARGTGADCYLPIGGGSTIGLAKALVLSSPAPVLAIPTTYAGSEMTTIYGITERGEKKTGRDERVLPQTVIYDPSLTVGLPVGLSASSGMNAIAHCVEALYAPDGNPVISLIAEEGIRALGEALPVITQNPTDPTARTKALYGAWLAGTALGSTAMGLHHKLCHVLGGGWRLPHAETHCAILPHAMHYNRIAASEAERRICAALRSADAAGGLYDLEAKLGVTTNLAGIGMPQAGLADAARAATQSSYPNPVPLSFDGVLRLLENAYAGIRPGD
ncbi:MAG: maleylacetate reductase, partial [Betaproteobacteria bacterium]